MTPLTPEFWLAIVGQTIIIVAAVITAFVRTDRRITKMETKIEHIESIENHAELEICKLDARVQGISRAVARLEGAHQFCPLMKGSTEPVKSNN